MLFVYKCFSGWERMANGGLLVPGTGCPVPNDYCIYLV